MEKIKAKKFNTFEELNDQPGSYTLSEGSDKKMHPFMYLPCGHGFFPDGRWEEQDIEDENLITLRPSIQCSPVSDHNPIACWHGYLTKGEFIKV